MLSSCHVNLQDKNGMRTLLNTFRDFFKGLSQVSWPTDTFIMNWHIMDLHYGVLCRKQVSRAGASNYIRQYMWYVSNCAYPWYLPRAQHSWYLWMFHFTDRSIQSGICFAFIVVQLLYSFIPLGHDKTKVVYIKHPDLKKSWHYFFAGSKIKISKT